MYYGLRNRSGPKISESFTAAAEDSRTLGGDNTLFKLLALFYCVQSTSIPILQIRKHLVFAVPIGDIVISPLLLTDHSVFSSVFGWLLFLRLVIVIGVVCKLLKALASQERN